MLNNNENHSLEQALQIINSHKLKSNSLKNIFLKSLNNNEYPAKVLSYLGELEYDLETLNNLLTNFQLYYNNLMDNIKNSSMKENNFNDKINKLYDSLKTANNEIINLKNENNILKTKPNNVSFDYLNTNYDENNFNKINKNNGGLNNFRNYLKYNSCNITINDNDDNLNGQKRNNICIPYGRLTYIRSNNGYNTNDNINNNKFNIINNNYNNNNSDNNINDKIYYNLDNNYNDMNNIKDLNNNKDKLLERMSQPKKNFLSYEFPKKENAIMNSRRMPKFYNKNIKQRISEIPKEKDNKINRINNILSLISSKENENLLNELKLIFGNNIESRLSSGDINNEYLDKIEDILSYNINKPIIPLSKRFQMQNRARSNSDKKSKKNIKYNNGSKRLRFLRQKLSEKKPNIKINKKGFNTQRDFYSNRGNNYFSNN